MFCHVHRNKSQKTYLLMPKKLHPQYSVFYRKIEHKSIENSASLKRIFILVTAINPST